MFEEQKIINIESAQLINEAAKLKKEGFRLVQICCSSLECLELTYSFDKDYCLLNLRFRLPFDNARLCSISSIYENAFIYENELQDLFGIEVTGLSLDYQGKFYRTKIKWPYRQSE
jgi:ech hydrogenase subunit D